MWGALLGLGGGALMGAKKHQREQEIEDADKKLVAASQRYSWATGNAPESASSINRAGSAFGNIGQGALAGAMFGSQFGQPAQPKSIWEQLQDQAGAGASGSGGAYGNRFAP